MGSGQLFGERQGPHKTILEVEFVLLLHAEIGEITLAGHLLHKKTWGGGGSLPCEAILSPFGHSLLICLEKVPCSCVAAENAGK